MNMKKTKRLSPSRQDLIVATFKALQSLNRSAPLKEIFERLVLQEKYSDAIMNEMLEKVRLVEEDVQ